ncbi:hypothetical protein [Cryptosporangium sp. NPDC048952]|uniref:hypothetical protein n=1 Tax=Cryptosporangium sp. NPDC048952 TaxID=3363961 RepID=UPI00371A09A1
MLRAVPAGRLGGEAADVWRTPEVERLIRALNVWRVGAGDFLAMAADAEWPVFPGAQVVAGLVVAAERAVPGCRVSVVSWSPGAVASARRSLRIRVEIVHEGAAGDVTARLTVDQRGSPRGPRRTHGHAVVLLIPDAPAADDEASGGEAAGGAPSGGSGAAGRGGAADDATSGDAAAGNAPGADGAPGGRGGAVGRARAADGTAGSGLVPAGVLEAIGGLDPTAQRALLAYVGVAAAVPGGVPATVVASTIAFSGPVGTGLTLNRLGGVSTESHAHAMAEFRTGSGAPVVQISQAVLLG